VKRGDKIGYMTKQTIKSTGCCEPFDPTKWTHSTSSGQAGKIVWKDKLFVVDHVISFLHIPLNYGQVMTRNMKLIESAGVKTGSQLVLTDEKSMWGADVYIDVAKEVPGAQMTTLSGTFLTKVFEGPYQNIGKWIKEMEEYVKSKNEKMIKLYFSYTTCPKCAKVYGKNYVVLFVSI
jgi:hypothetical protein